MTHRKEGAMAGTTKTSRNTGSNEHTVPLLNLPARCSRVLLRVCSDTVLLTSSSSEWA